MFLTRRRGSVWGGGGQEDDVAGDRRRRGPNVHHVLPWQIGRVGFNRPSVRLMPIRRDEPRMLRR